MVGEVTRHKNSDIALAAAEKARVKMKVVGGGPDLPRLRQRFQRAEFLGRVGDRQLTELYARCRALVVPAIEEFGITMVEAHAAGRPVVAATGGGALEIVSDGLTGILVPPRSVDALADAMRATDWESFGEGCLRSSAGRFSSREFRRRFMPAVADTLARAANVPDAWPGTPRRRRPPRPSPAHAAALLAASSIVGGSLARSRHRS